MSLSMLFLSIIPQSVTLRKYVIMSRFQVLIVKRINAMKEEKETENEKGKEKEPKYSIIVNGTQKSWDKHKIDFKDVIILAFGTFVDKPTMVYTVAHEDGPKQNPE